MVAIGSALYMAQFSIVFNFQIIDISLTLPYSSPDSDNDKKVSVVHDNCGDLQWTREEHGRA